MRGKRAECSREGHTLRGEGLANRPALPSRQVRSFTDNSARTPSPITSETAPDFHLAGEIARQVLAKLEGANKPPAKR